MAPESPTPLADLIGIPPWLHDLITAGLGSFGLNGLACGLLMFGAHGAHKYATAKARASQGVQNADDTTPPSPETGHPRTKPKRRPGTEHAARSSVSSLTRMALLTWTTGASPPACKRFAKPGLYRLVLRAEPPLVALGPQIAAASLGVIDADMKGPSAIGELPFDGAPCRHAGVVRKELLASIFWARQA